MKSGAHRVMPRASRSCRTSTPFVSISATRYCWATASTPRFVKQAIAGSKVHSVSGDNSAIYQWAPYGSWPYPDLYVTQ